MKTLKYIFGIMIIMVFSCQPSEKTGNIEAMYASGATDNQTDESFVKSEIENIFLGSATPCDIPFILKETKVDFDPTLINSINNLPPQNLKNYEMAMNLGVYTTDFGYLASFNRFNDAMIYLKYCKDMAKELGISTAFDIELVRDVENKIESPDALSRIVRNEERNIAKYIKGDFRNESAALVITGGLVEGLYISTELLERNYETDKDCIPTILELISNQEEALASTILLLEALHSDDAIHEYIDELRNLHFQLAHLDIENEDLKSNESWWQFRNAINYFRSKIIVNEEFLVLPG